MEPTTGTFEWGVTITTAYLPNDVTSFFTKNETLYEWLGKHSTDTSENFLRQYLGKMLFTGDNLTKSLSVCWSVINLTPRGPIDKYMDFEDYLTDEKIKALHEEKYK